MQWRLPLLAKNWSALSRQWVQNRFFASRIPIPTFPDPPCQEIDEKCHHVSRDSCEHARHTLTRVLPADRYLDQMQREGPGKCCIYRPSHRHPCPEKHKCHKKPKIPKLPFRSMWEPPCKPNEQPYCKDLFPRFDQIYYKPSERCRCYQRTWIECPRVKLKMKKVCCLDGIEPPEVYYRFKERCPKVACELDFEHMRRICQHLRNPEFCCDKIYWPCCKAARCDPHCIKKRFPSNCRKLKAPFPSYSESTKIWSRPRRKSECQCLRPLHQCEILAYTRRKALHKLKQI